MKSKLTVSTPVGTFTRTTARPYSHVVTFRHGNVSKLIALRREVELAGSDASRAWWQQHLDWASDAAATAGVSLWSSRLELARKDAAKLRADYTDVRIFEVVTGQEVK